MERTTVFASARFRSMDDSARTFLRMTGYIAVVALCAALVANVQAGPPPKLVPDYTAGTLIAGPYVLIGKGGTMHVRWETQGESGYSLVFRHADTPLKLIGQLMPASPATVKLPGRVYDVEIPELPPCSTIKYRLEPTETGDSWRELRTAPAPGKLCPEGLRVMVYGDSRTNHRVHGSLIPSMLEARPDLLLNVGDIVHTARRVYEWHKFFEIERRLLESAPIALVPGNHEGYKDSEFGSASMNRYFEADGVGGTGHRVLQYGPLYVVLLDLYWGADLQGEGLEWCSKALARAPERALKVVIMHEPIISFGHHKPREELLPLRGLFAERGVSLVFAGHSHMYEHFRVGEIRYLTVGGTAAPLHEPLENVVENEKRYFVDSGRFHHFAMLELTHRGAKLLVTRSDTGKLIGEWDIASPKSGASWAPQDDALEGEQPWWDWPRKGQGDEGDGAH